MEEQRVLESVLGSLRNWFEKQELTGDYHIVGGSLCLPLKGGQYFRIVGSTFNDGLHRYPCFELVDEDFHGTVYGLAVPNAVIELAHDVGEWIEEFGAHEKGPYKSESFGGYSYTKADEKGGKSGWEAAFKDELNRWRKM